MNARRLALFCTVGCIATLGVHAQQSDRGENSRVLPRPAVVAPERSAPIRPETATPARVQRSGSAPEPVPVDSVADDLQKIVVLCATEPESDEFKTEWANFIEKHPVAAEDLDALIDDILTRAEAHRAAQPARSRTNRVLVVMTTTRAMMHDTAMAIIRKIG